MANDIYNHRASYKGRSASICAPGSSSMEEIMSSGSPAGYYGGTKSGTGTPTHVSGLPPGTPETGTPGTGRRRKPAARSQSARIPSGRSIRRKVVNNQLQSNNNQGEKVSSLHNSEPRLTETPEPSPGIRRRGSRRATSVYQHRKSAAFLDVPDRNNRNDEEEDEDSYRLRSFSSTSKGIVNRGDSFRRRRSRSGSLVPGAVLLGNQIEHGDTPPRWQTGAIEPVETKTYKVALMGAPGVGKTALISQFMTSECINAYDRQKDVPGEQRVSIMLNGEESELVFSIIKNSKDVDKSDPPDAFLVLYSVVDRASVTRAEAEIRILHESGLLRGRPVLLAANKIDLARSRAVNAQDGKCLACTYRAKFIEISVGINHNCDELLVGILNQIRLKQRHFEEHGGGEDDNRTAHWYKSRGVVRASMKARQMITWIFGKEDSKFKNCENLNIL